MNIFEKNMLFFKENSEYIYNIIAEQQAKFPISLEKSEEQDNYILENGDTRSFVHSIYDVDREMKEAFKNVSKETEVIILFGFGCGYALEYMVNNFRNINRVIIIEPFLDLFREVLKNFDMHALKENIRHINLFLNEGVNEVAGELTALISGLANKNIRIVYHVSYRSLLNGYYETLNEFIVNQIRKIRANVGTMHVSNLSWAANTMSNLKIDSLPAELLLNNLKGIKAGVVVSAGPSLNKNMHLIHKLKEKALVVAVGSAIRILDQNGITPHLRIAIDGNPNEDKVLDGIDTEKVPLLFSGNLYKSILPKYKGPKFRLIINTNNLMKYIYNKINHNFISIHAGFSVSNIAMQLLATLQCEKVILMGQDLCYTERSLYARGAWTDEKIDISSKGYIKTNDIYGNEVYTSLPFITIKNLFEEAVKFNSNTKFINCTEGGLHIDGMPDKPLQEVLDSLNENVFADKAITGVCDKSGSVENKEFDSNIYTAVLDIDNEAREIVDINEKRIKKLKNLQKKLHGGRNVREAALKFKSMNEYEDRLNEIQLYAQVIKIELNEVFYAIELNNIYDGDDDFKWMDSQIEILIKRSLQVKQYAMLLNELVKEYKNSFPGS